MSKPVAVYLRISLDQSGEKKAVERQREDAMNLISQESSWEFYKVYQDDGISASKREKVRPAYEEMRADFEAGRFSVLVCYDLDRLTRQPSQLEWWIDQAEDRGLRIVTLNGEADLDKDAGRLFARIKVAVARSETDRMGARRRRSNEQIVATGKPAPGRRPYGWKKGGVKIEISEALRVRTAYRYVAAGGSLRGLVRHWNSKGVPSPQGTPWTAFKVRQVLDRERNYGALIRYGVEQEKSTIEPIVDRELHDRVQAIIAGRAQPGRKPEKSLLSGLAVCGTCGAQMGAKRLRDGSGERVPYYVCSSRINRNVASDGKKHPTVRFNVLETEVEKQVASAFLFGSTSLFPAAKGNDLGELYLSLKQTQEAIERVVDGVSEGVFKEGQAAARMAALNREEESILRAIQHRQAEDASLRFADIRTGITWHGTVPLAQAAEIRAALTENFKSLPFNEKRKLIQALLDIQVRTGYGAKRVDITHKLVPTLNQDHDS